MSLGTRKLCVSPFLFLCELAAPLLPPVVLSTKVFGVNWKSLRNPRIS
jgi:hypothetical protein